MNIKRILVFIILSLGLVASEVSFFMPAPASGSEAALETRGRLFDKLNRFFDWLMSFQELSYSVDALKLTLSAPPDCIVNFENEHGFFAKKKPLVGQFTPSKEDIQLAQTLLLDIHTSVEDPIKRHFYIHEVLAKVIAYRALDEGDTLLIPTHNPSEEPLLYRVSKIFNLGLTMPAFGLVSSQDALLIFRGTHLDLTDKSGIASIVADLDLYGPGYTAFFHIKDQLESFFVKQSLNQKKVRVTGYSLGGILTLYTEIFLSPYLDIARCMAFNPPGVQKKLLKLCQTDPQINQLNVFVNQHDPVSKWGFLVGNVEVLQAIERMGPLKAHTALMSAEGQLDFYKCNLEQENDRHNYFFFPAK